MSDPRAYAVLGQDTARHRVLLTVFTYQGMQEYCSRCLECGWQQITTTSDHAELLGQEHRRGREQTR